MSEQGGRLSHLQHTSESPYGIVGLGPIVIDEGAPIAGVTEKCSTTFTYFPGGDNPAGCFLVEHPQSLQVEYCASSSMSMAISWPCPRHCHWACSACAIARQLHHNRGCGDLWDFRVSSHRRCIPLFQYHDRLHRVPRQIPPSRSATIPCPDCFPVFVVHLPILCRDGAAYVVQNAFSGCRITILAVIE